MASSNAKLPHSSAVDKLVRQYGLNARDALENLSRSDALRSIDVEMRRDANRARAERRCERTELARSRHERRRIRRPGR